MTALEFEPTEDDERTPPQRSNAFVRVAGRTLLPGVLVVLCGYLSVAALLAVIMSAAQDPALSLVTVLGAAMPGWLAALQVPMTVAGSSLSAWPLLATLLVALLIAKASADVARRSHLRQPSHAVPVVVIMASLHAVPACAMALMLDAGGTVRVNSGVATCCAVLFAAVAATVGLADRCGLLYPLWQRCPNELWAGLRAGLGTFAAVIGAGALVLVVGVSLSFPELHAASVRAGSLGDALGVTLLSLLYLPNAVLAAWSYATGVGLSIGGFAFDPLTAGTEGMLPTIPLVAVLGTPPSTLFMGSLLALAGAVGCLLGWSCRDSHARLSGRLLVIGFAALTTATGVSVLGMLAGGRVGNGAFDPVTLHPVALAITTFGWIAVPAGLMCWLAHSGGVAGFGRGDHAAEGVLEDVDVEEADVLEDDEDATGDADQTHDLEAGQEPDFDAEFTDEETDRDAPAGLDDEDAPDRSDDGSAAANPELDTEHELDTESELGADEFDWPETDPEEIESDDSRARNGP